MIEAELPGGHVLEFPDGTADEVVQRTVKKHLADAPSVGGSLARGVMKGLTFGFNDEIAAGGSALVQGADNLLGAGGPSMGEVYDQRLARNREIDQRDMQDNPGTNITGQVLGSVGGAVGGGVAGVGAGAARLAAPVAARVAPYVNPLLANVPGWLGTAGRIAGAGAASGGVAGVGEGEGGVANRLVSGAEGAAVGGAAGLAIGAGVRGLSGAAGRVTHALGLRDPEAAAERHILRNLDRGGVGVDDVRTRFAADPDTPLALVDVGGRNVTQLGAVAANTPGGSMQSADDFAQARRLGRPERLMAAGDEAFGGGSGADVADATAARQTQRRVDAAPLYERAFSQPAGMTEPIAGMLEDPIAQTGLANGLRIQRIENATRKARGEAEIPVNDPAIQFDPDGTPRLVGVPNMRSLDAVKRGIDQTLDAARDPQTHQINWTEELRAIDAFRRQWVTLLDENNPDYAAARAAWAGPSAQLEATQAGQTAFRTNRDIVAGRMQRQAPDEQDAYRLGAGRDFADRVSDPGRAVGAARKILEDHQMQSRLNSLLSPAELERFNRILGRENEMANVERAVSPRANSHTARLEASGEDLGRDPVGPLMTAGQQLFSGRPIAAAGTVLQDQWRRIGQGINPATADALANRLFNVDQAQRPAVINQLARRQVMDRAAADRFRRNMGPVQGAVGTIGGLQVN